MNTGSALAQFTITLTQAASEQVAVDWYTSDGTALANVDYAANKGTVVFAPGETSKTVDILVYGRAVGSEDRSFFVEMLPPVNAILGAAIGECIIHVDTTSSTPVTQIIVPTGPTGPQGAPGPEGPEGPKGDTPTAEDIKDSEFNAKGTSVLAHPDVTTIAETARRIAYVAEAKIATVVLADGDNLLAQSDLTGDAVDFNSVGLYPRIARGTTFISPEWTLEDDGRLLIKNSAAGDVLYVCQYDVVSERVIRTNLSAGEVYSFQAGSVPAPTFTKAPKVIKGVDLAAVPVTSITVLASSVMVAVSNAADFVVGAYAFIIGNSNLTVAGCFKVLSKAGNNIELAFHHNYISTVVTGVTAKPIVSILTVQDNEGVKLVGEVRSMSNIVFDAVGKQYGVVAGSKYEQGFNKPVCNIEEAKFVHVEGGARVAWCIGGGGSALGVNGISAGNCGRGILSAYGASVVGTGAYIYNAGEDAFKCEHSGDMYITSYNGLKTSSESIFGSRYASSQEMADGFAVVNGNLSIGTSQFNAYLSLRNLVAKGQSTYGINATDGGAVTLTSVDASACTGSVGVRAKGKASVRTISGVNNFSAFTKLTEIASASVEIDGVVYSGKSVLATVAVGTINANSRFAQQRTLTGYILGNNLPIVMTINTDLPAGIIPYVLAISDNLVRVALHNVTGSAVVVGDIPILLSW